jgi:hypothetical protein
MMTFNPVEERDRPLRGTSECRVVDADAIENPRWPCRQLDRFQDDGLALAPDGDGVSFQAESLGQSHQLRAVGPYDLGEFHRVLHPGRAALPRPTGPAVGRFRTCWSIDSIIPLGVDEPGWVWANGGEARPGFAFTGVWGARFCAHRSEHTHVPSGVASGRLAVGSALMQPRLFAAARLSPSARKPIPGTTRLRGAGSGCYGRSRRIRGCRGHGGRSRHR